MEERQLEGGGKLIENRIYVPHLDQTLVFNLPGTGPQPYWECVKALKSQNLKPATTGQTLSLLKSCMQNESLEPCKSVVYYFLKKGIFTCTEIAAYKKELVLYDNPEGDNLLDKKCLRNLRKKKDSSIRTISSRLDENAQEKRKFLQHPFVSAQINNKRLKDTLEWILWSLPFNDPQIFGPHLNPGSKCQIHPTSLRKYELISRFQPYLTIRFSFDTNQYNHGHMIGLSEILSDKK